MGYNYDNTNSIDPMAVMGPGPDNYGRDRHFVPVNAPHGPFTHHSPSDEKPTCLNTETIAIIKSIIDMNTRILDNNERLLKLLEQNKCSCGTSGHTSNIR